ncbi:MAG: hypothetical protein RLZZ21_1394 [Planctomycetota bacterium]|jgi:hypothetical protein
MGKVTFMPAVSQQEILDHVERTVDTTGWVRKEVALPEPFRAIVTISFKDSEPRTFHLVSNNFFASLDDVRIYEVKP